MSLPSKCGAGADPCDRRDFARVIWLWRGALFRTVVETDSEEVWSWFQHFVTCTGLEGFQLIDTAENRAQTNQELLQADSCPKDFWGNPFTFTQWPSCFLLLSKGSPLHTNICISYCKEGPTVAYLLACPEWMVEVFKHAGVIEAVKAVPCCKHVQLEHFTNN